MNQFLSSVLVLLVVFSIHGVTVNAAGGLVNDVCNKASANPTVKYAFCFSSLEANPSSRTADIFGLGEISAEMTLSKASYVVTRINSLKGGKISSDVRGALDACSNYYNTVAMNAQGAVDAFKRRDFSAAGTRMFSAIEAAQNCQDGFQYGIYSPVQKDIDASVQLNWISYTIAGMNH